MNSALLADLVAWDLNADDTLLHISWFDAAVEVEGPAYGDAENIRWDNMTSVLQNRREGEKDGPNFVPARFVPQKHRGYVRVRRLKANLKARTAVALDIEANKVTGEVPPGLKTVAERLRASRMSAVLYTSHSHTPHDTRFRVVLPLSEEIAHDLPAPEIIADALGLAGVLDRSKIGASSLFYLPSCALGAESFHRTLVVNGHPLDAAVVKKVAGELLAERAAAKERQAAEARAAAEARRQAKLAAGFDPNNSLIEKLRPLYDLEQVLLAHNYDKAGSKYRHPDSSSGSYGADIKSFGGIQRVYSHNATDPLHPNNLPAWTDGVTALDVIDVVIILEFGGDRQKALHELAKRHELDKSEERKAVARLIFGMRRLNASQVAIEAAAYAEGKYRGLPPNDVERVASWVVGQLTGPREAV